MTHRSSYTERPPPPTNQHPPPALPPPPLTTDTCPASPPLSPNSENYIACANAWNLLSQRTLRLPLQVLENSPVHHAKVAHASQKGGSLYTAGVRTQEHVARKLKEKKIVFPSQDELFLKTHVKKKKNGTYEVEWVKPRAKDTWVGYKDMVHEY
ncbi:hypothetical protein K7X08_005101 [Anisodus acutangulus]|uniref:Uncharacterized protein n=1 Tax=Anisodus acutangulus TaxID=402998 RepID=A0A9Q1MEQ9_9SOLA|nr:hypothetical protein K7X08_005101 [Anisodus acutangulus]